MIQFDQINSHPKYNLIIKNKFKIMFICKISHARTHARTHRELSDKEIEETEQEV